MATCSRSGSKVYARVSARSNSSRIVNRHISTLAGALAGGLVLGIACLGATTTFAADGGNLSACKGVDCQVVAKVDARGSAGNALDGSSSTAFRVVAANADANPRTAGATPMHFVNRRTGQCLDVAQARMTDGTNVIQRPCNGSANQSWAYDDSTGFIQSMRDPRYCLDNSGTYADGANIRVWTCNGSADQRFKFDPAVGKIAMRNFTDQVVDASGPDTGAHVMTWSFWGGGNQLWDMVP